MTYLRSFLLRLALPLALPFASVTSVEAQTVTLDTFNSGSATGSVIAGPPASSWVGNVVQNAGSITVGGTARDDNGWAANGLSLNASAMNYVQISAQRDPGNAAQTLTVQLLDTGLNSAVFTVNTGAFTAGAVSHVQIPIASWDAGFDPTQISSWSIGGGTTGLATFHMTLDDLGLSASLRSLASGGTIVTAGDQVYSSAVTLGAATTLGTTGTNGNAITFNATIDGAHALTLNTPGTTTLGGAVGGETPLSSLTTDAGGTTAINGGEVVTTGAQTYGDAVSLGADTILRSLSSFITFLSGLDGNGHDLLIDVAHASSFRAASDLASFTKSGAGTLTLLEPSTFTGPTIVNAGTLALGVNNALFHTSPMTLAGGTFSTGGFDQTLGMLTLSGSSSIDFVSGTSALAFADSHTVAWHGTLTLLNFTSASDSLRFGSNQTGLTLAQLAMIDFGTGLAAQIDANGYVTASAIPEPSTYALIGGSAMLGFALWRRRRSRVAASRG